MRGSPEANDPIFTLIDPDRVEDLLRDFKIITTLGGPTELHLQQAPLLTGWDVVRFTGTRLTGRVQGHPHIADGHRALTSALFAIDPRGRWVRSANRWYRLGARAPNSAGKGFSRCR